MVRRRAEELSRRLGASSLSSGVYKLFSVIFITIAVREVLRYASGFQWFLFGEGSEGSVVSIFSRGVDVGFDGAFFIWKILLAQQRAYFIALRRAEATTHSMIFIPRIAERCHETIISNDTSMANQTGSVTIAKA